MTAPTSAEASLDALRDCRDRLVAQIGRRVVGQLGAVNDLVTCVFAGGHALLVGVPGLAKTLLASTTADALDLEFSRIQFTPDLMPSDVTGAEILDQDADGRRAFRFVAGPVFTNVLLADEINRAPPKTQSALLQAMQEQEVSVSGKQHRLPEPFFVLATQNPIEQEGTYPLPEAQLDRFMIQISMDYPSAEEEAKIVALGGNTRVEVEPVLHGAELSQHRATVADIPIAASVAEHIVALLRASRPTDPSCPSDIRELLQWGAGPRAGQQLAAMARARAALDARPAATVDDVRAVAPAVLGHRVVLSLAAQTQGVSHSAVMEHILASAR